MPPLLLRKGLTPDSQLLRSIVTVDWSQFEGLAALRCTVGVAVPLLVGHAIDQPAVGLFGAMGAVGVGFGSFQSAYRGRAAIMLLAAAGMAFSVFVGTLAGHSTMATIAVAALWAFAGGLLVALGHGAFVGLQSIIAVLIAGGFPADLEDAAARAALVLGGGLVQTFLVVLIWPLRRFAIERRSLAAAYGTLAEYALTIPAREALPPEPHTFAGTPSPLADPQPFARSSEVFVFQALLDEAERIRASLAALAVHGQRLKDADHPGAAALADLSAQALAEIAAALAQGREPHEPPGFPESLTRVEQSPSAIAVEPLLTQIRAAWRTASVLTGAPSDLILPREQIARRTRRPAMRDALITLRANFTMRSTAFRHAIRLAAILTIAAAAARVFELPRGYWLPMTIAVVLKPDFHDTFAFSVGRVAGTVLGAAGATATVLLFAPGPNTLIALVLASVWGGYLWRTANYGVFSICITGYVVFLMTFSEILGITSATDRIIYTAIAGLLALCAYVAWPTWVATEARPAIAAMLDAQSGYLGKLLEAYAAPSTPELKQLDEFRSSARVARSNAEAVVERMLTEPRSRHAMSPRTAVGIVAATRRNALAALSLHAGLERDFRGVVPGVREIASQVASSLLTLATAVREGSTPRQLPPLRKTGRAPTTVSRDLASEETDLVVDSIETIAELLAKEIP